MVEISAVVTDPGVFQVDVCRHIRNLLCTVKNVSSCWYFSEGCFVFSCLLVSRRSFTISELTGISIGSLSKFPLLGPKSMGPISSLVPPPLVWFRE